MTAGKVFAAGKRQAGSQRARDIFKAMGEQAFQWFPITTGFGPQGHSRLQRPLGGRQIAQLKKEHLMEGRWGCATSSDLSWPACARMLIADNPAIVGHQLNTLPGIFVLSASAQPRVALAALDITD
jgi:hypothetical protein